LNAVVRLPTEKSTCLNGQNTRLSNTDAELRLTADEFMTAQRYDKTFYSYYNDDNYDGE